MSDKLLREVEVKLVDLGESADQVAANLATAGIRGIRQQQACCPVANYMKWLGCEHPTVNVDEHRDEIYARTDHGFVDVPEAVAEFVYNFDAGMYDELAEGGAS